MANFQLEIFKKGLCNICFENIIFPGINDLETDLNDLIEPINAEKILYVVLIL